MSDEISDREYVDALLKSELAEVVIDKQYDSEILAQALLEVLHRHKIIDRFEVTKEFENIMKGQLKQRISQVVEEEKVP